MPDIIAKIPLVCAYCPPHRLVPAVMYSSMFVWLGAAPKMAIGTNVPIDPTIEAVSTHFLPTASESCPSAAMTRKFVTLSTSAQLPAIEPWKGVWGAGCGGRNVVVVMVCWWCFGFMCAHR